MSKLQSINKEQRLYVIECGKGYTCLGFDVCRKWAIGLEQWLKITPPHDLPDVGTSEFWDWYQYLLAAGERTFKLTGKRCPVELAPQLIGLEGKRVEVVDCWGNTSRFIVGKSTGFMPVHLEIKTKRSICGGAVVGFPFKSIRVVGSR